MTPYYQDDAVTIYHGDCREIIPWLAFEVIVTDPPYGYGHTSNHGASWENKEISGDRENWIPFLQQFDCPAAICGNWKSPRPEGAKACLVWDKGPAFGMGDLSFPWKMSHEFIWILGDGWSSTKRREGVLRPPVQVSWESRGRAHPHQKPIGLFTEIIASFQNGLILDPFMGSGTTLRAAKDLGRKAIGIEIEEKYCEIAAKRCAQEVMKLNDPGEVSDDPVGD